MIGWLLGIAVVVVAALFQVTIFPSISPTTFQPDAILALAMTWGALAGYRQAVMIGVGGGMLIDVWGDAPVGLSGLLVGLVSLLTVIGETPLVPSTILFPLALSFFGEIALQLVRLLVFQLIGRPVEFVDPSIAIILSTAAATSLLVLPMYPPARWLVRRFGPPRVEW